MSQEDQQARQARQDERPQPEPTQQRWFQPCPRCLAMRALLMRRLGLQSGRLPVGHRPPPKP